MPQAFNFEAGTKVAEFIASNKHVDYLQGPLGSGKTKAMCIRIMRHAQEQAKSPIDGLRYSRFALVRNTMPELQRSTIRTWLETFPEHVYGRFTYGAVKQHRIAFDDVRTEVDFISLDKSDDIKKLRSTEYTVIALNEATFIPREIFDEADSRLRYPPLIHGGPTYRGILMDGNAPDEDHWLAMITGQVDLPPDMTEKEREQYNWPPEWGFYLQPPAVLEEFDAHGIVVGYKPNPAAENLKNLQADYYMRTLRGKTRAWIDSRLMNRVALFVEGQAVWPMFRREYHVARETLRPAARADVIVALDFGRVYPAALFAQEIGQRLYVQYEILGFNEPATVFAPRVKRFLEQHYPGHSFRCIGDPKGADIGQQIDRSSYDIFKSFGMPVDPAPVKQNKIEERTEAVAYALNDNPAGVNYMVISPLCRTLIVGMAGRYHLVREQDGVLRPKKDKYSNLCDALQYLCIGLGVGRRMMGLQSLSQMVPQKIWHGRKSMRRVVA